MSLVLPLGDRAWVAPRPAATDTRALFDRLRALPGAEDVVITEGRVAIYGAVERVAFEAALFDAPGSVDAASEPRLHVIRVRYDGEDLPEVARACGLSAAEVVACHALRTYDARMIGFLPGFAYLGPLDPRISVPRRAVPRVRITPLAVGIAAHYTGVYPFASSGGWNLIGHAVGFSAFDPARGATLALGDRVRFEVAT